MPEREYVTPRQQTGIDWAKLFLENPELDPPGYHETVKAMYNKEDSTHEE